MLCKSEKDLKMIKVIYEDGTEKEIEKGAVVQLQETKETDSMTMEFVDITKVDLMKIIYGIMSLSVETELI